jgi:hypothetical protein
MELGEEVATDSEADDERSTAVTARMSE